MNKNKLEKIISEIKLWAIQHRKTRFINNEFSQKHSPFRKALARLLILWKEYRSILIVEKMTQTQIKTKTKKIQIHNMLSKYSKAYKQRAKYTTNEKYYASIWSLKLRILKILGGKCTKCGNNNPATLELHHLNQESKEYCLSDIIRKNYPVNNLYDEIKKCIILCRNCHQELHNENKYPKNLKNKKFILKILKNNGSCNSCGYNNNISCLEFHHKNPTKKKFEINQLTDSRRNYENMKISRDKFAIYIKEIKKCDVLCCNCHQLKHINIKQFIKLRLLIQIMERLIGRNYRCKGW